LPGDEAQSLVEKMRTAGISAAVVGEVVQDHPGKIFVY
jgi:hydrogenase maturation factor